MKSVVAVAFIGGIGAGGVYLGTKKTVIKGDVMAANMLEQVKSKGITRIDCDKDIPITNAGAIFTCTFNHRDGSTAKFEYTMNRKGGLAPRMLTSTEATEHREIKPGDDPWKPEDE